MANNQTIVPEHLGLILDGNRRWAKARGLPAYEGHRQGYETLKKIADECLQRGVKYLSVYAFSTENWGRDKKEISFIMKMVQEILTEHINDLDTKNVRFFWLGVEDGLNKNIITLLKHAEEKTRNNTGGTFALCFNYGGYNEIADAAQKLVDSGTEITPENIQSNLYGGNDIPDVDFLIRTSGERRISNFMLWRAAYSELYFTDVLWPDFSKTDLELAFADYAERQRRFGK